MRFPVFIAGVLLIVFMTSGAIGRGIEGPGSDRVIYEYGERVLQNPHHRYDTNLLRECMGFYLDNQQYDSPAGSYNKALRLGYQIVSSDRRDVDTYTMMAWLLWSKWVCWTKRPNQMPDGEGKADEAIELLNWGKQWNSQSARFHKESADTIWPLAKYYRTDLYDFVIENYRKADLLAVANDFFKVRVRLNLGHIYRQTGRKRPAVYWYQRVLEIAPDNEIAGRYLACLENEPDGKTRN